MAEVVSTPPVRQNVKLCNIPANMFEKVVDTIKLRHPNKLKKIMLTFAQTNKTFYSIFLTRYSDLIQSGVHISWGIKLSQGQVYLVMRFGNNIHVIPPFPVDESFEKLFFYSLWSKPTETKLEIDEVHEDFMEIIKIVLDKSTNITFFPMQTAFGKSILEILPKVTHLAFLQNTKKKIVFEYFNTFHQLKSLTYSAVVEENCDHLLTYFIQKRRNLSRLILERSGTLSGKVLIQFLKNASSFLQNGCMIQACKILLTTAQCNHILHTYGVNIKRLKNKLSYFKISENLCVWINAKIVLMDNQYQNGLFE